METFKIPVENGDSEAVEGKMSPAESEGMMEMKDRIKELEEKGDDLSEEEAAELGEIIAKGDKIIEDYEARNRWEGFDEEADPEEQLDDREE